ncbi:L-lactate dehydrogenase B chain [Echinococcus granulosus]|uniref:L-lactate dehydrogenase n=1 Tax=Echinococcus granulosus TaxID=6210 RepID=A0A068WL40_ECHGR|nr:L-lactate dehydrogenase B chain [Echinococcus granulosus]CDS18320.1 lactate dehydrogenase a [Echinococcus granulosus]
MLSSVLHPVTPNCYCVKPRAKVTVVGSGSVGMACAFAIMMKLCLIDVMTEKVKGEVMDLEQGQQFLNNCKIRGGSDHALSAGSDVIVITAGVRQQPGESRLNLVQRNTDIYKDLIPSLVKHSPDAVLLVVSNPVDIMTYVTWKLSGFPRNRVLGSGTTLDSARFRFFLAQRFGVDPQSVHGIIIGEHGDSSVAVWSKVTVGGCNLYSVNPAVGTDSDIENFGQVHKDTVGAAYEIINRKGYTAWAIGVSTWKIVDLILNNKNAVIPVTTAVKGLYGITDDAFLSLPCVVGATGIASVVNIPLDDAEITSLQKSAQLLRETTDGINW